MTLVNSRPALLIKAVFCIAKRLNLSLSMAVIIKTCLLDSSFVKANLLNKGLLIKNALIKSAPIKIALIKRASKPLVHLVLLTSHTLSRVLPVKFFLQTLVLGSTFSMVSFPLPAMAKDALKMTLTASKVMVDNQGNQVFIPVNTAKVGTLIQYKATYSNTLDTSLQNTMITLPIPANTQFTGDAFPPSAQASIDYHNYQDLPLMRIINGKIVAIPLSEYKSLRWNIKYIPPKKSVNVAFNTIVN